LKQRGILAVFHYQSLHKSRYYAKLHDNRVLVNSDNYEESLLRLPFFFEITTSEIDYIVESISELL
ncbi:MAG: DegT/DnrJ/EryC1/StrS family aminotransferase, partial [Bacteroidia bacterium]|nr:DegT/DnrJ/EryC1/StrS family aminotransferase [Bacteroidia bacterium]